MSEEKSTNLTKEQEELYKKTMEEAKRQLEDIDGHMQIEIQKLRERLAQLQESKKSFRQIYEGTAKLLGIEVEPEDEKEKELKVEEKEESKEEKDKGQAQESQPSSE